MISHKVAGGGGISLHVAETGNPHAPPILFLHGYSQCRLNWSKQLHSSLADGHRLVAMDLRGHGLSEKPQDAYGDGSLWAEDIAAVIETLRLERPVLVGWSYGGAVIADYLRHHGAAKIAGIGLVAAVTKLGKPAGPFLGPDFAALIRDFFSEDYETGVGAMAALTSLCFAVEPEPDDFYRMLGYAVAVPPHVRSALFRRALDTDDLLPGLDCPVFLCHGSADRVILPAMSEHHKALMPWSTFSLHRGIGHAPFLENPARFNRELAQFVREANG